MSRWPKRNIGQNELFREMVRVYRSYRKRHPEPEIDQKWVIQVLREAQEEEKRNPMTDEEAMAISEELMRYGAQQAKKMGITLEDVDRIIHEERARRKTTYRP